MIGSMSQKQVIEPAAFERANYMKTLASYREWRMRNDELGEQRWVHHACFSV